MFCTADDTFGQGTPPSQVQNKQYIEIDAGGNHTCAIDSTGLQIDCWGSDYETFADAFSEFILQGTGSPIINIKQLTLGSHSTCWVARTTNNDLSDTLMCWNPGKGLRQIITIGRGEINSVSIDDNYRCYTWGSGELDCRQDIGWTTLSVPVNLDLAGPYTQVAVAGGVVCALDSAGRLGCDTSVFDGESPFSIEASIAAEIDDGVAQLSNRRFTHLQAYPSFFIGTGVGFCMLDTQEATHCIGIHSESNGSAEDSPYTFTGFDDDGTSGPDVSDDAFLTITDIDVYGQNSLELFWSPRVNFLNYSHVNIFRNGSLLTSTTNNNSFFDTGLAADTTYTYEVQEVNLDGQSGEFSNSFSVTTAPGIFDGSDVPVTDISECDDFELPAPVALRVLKYGPSVGEVFWQPDRYDARIGVTFNLFIDGEQVNDEPIKNNGSFYLLGENQYNEAFNYSLNATDKCGRVTERSNVVP